MQLAIISPFLFAIMKRLNFAGKVGILLPFLGVWAYSYNIIGLPRRYTLNRMGPYFMGILNYCIVQKFHPLLAGINKTVVNLVAMLVMAIYGYLAYNVFLWYPSFSSDFLKHSIALNIPFMLLTILCTTNDKHNWYKPVFEN